MTVQVQHDIWTFKPGLWYLSTSAAEVAFLYNVLVFLEKIDFVTLLPVCFSVAF